MKKIVTTNPGRNYEVVGEFDVTSNSDIRQKVKEANDAKEDWRRFGAVKRAALLQKAYQAFKKRADEIAEIITKEIGAPITECKEEIAWDWGYFEWFLNNAEKYLTPEIIQEDDNEIFTQKDRKVKKQRGSQRRKHTSSDETDGKNKRRSGKGGG